METRHLYLILTGPSFAVQTGGMDSLESFPGLLKRLQIRALVS
jgi:hypothetical protein